MPTINKAATRAAALLLSLLVGACGGQSVSEPLTEGRQAQLSAEWDTYVGSMSPLHQPTLTNDGTRLCTISKKGTASFISAADGTHQLRQIDFPTPRSDFYTAGAGCDGDIAAAVSSDGWLRVYDGNEGLLWQENLKTRVYGTPLLTRGKLFIIGLDGRLLAFTLKRGRELWRYVSPLENLVRTPLDSSLVINEDIVYAGIDNGAIVALDQSNGRVLWENTVAASTGNNEIANILDVTTPVVLEDKVCASAYQSGISCFNRQNGDRLWLQPLPSHTRVAADADNNRVYATDNDGVLYAFDATNGQLLWRNKTELALSAPLYSNNMIYVGDTRGHVHAYFADNGDTATSLRLTTGDILNLTALPNSPNTFVALTQDGELIRVRADL